MPATPGHTHMPPRCATKGMTSHTNAGIYFIIKERSYGLRMVSALSIYTYATRDLQSDMTINAG